MSNPTRQNWAKLSKEAAAEIERRARTMSKAEAAKSLNMGVYTLYGLLSGGTARPDTIRRLEETVRKQAEEARKHDEEQGGSDQDVCLCSEVRLQGEDSASTVQGRCEEGVMSTAVPTSTCCPSTLRANGSMEDSVSGARSQRRGM